MLITDFFEDALEDALEDAFEDALEDAFEDALDEGLEGSEGLGGEGLGGGGLGGDGSGGGLGDSLGILCEIGTVSGKSLVSLSCLEHLRKLPFASNSVIHLW